jgi:hypothetical protein
MGRSGGLIGGISDAYGLYRGIMRDRALDEAWNTKPEENSQYTPDQAQQLEAAANAKDDQGNPLYSVQANEGGTYSVTPTAGGETSALAPVSQFKMGNLVQDMPFNPDLIRGERARQQGDV